MAETENIAKIAGKISTDIFSAFGWRTAAPRNENWDCTAKKRHQTQPGTHPSDIVFSYEDPYDVGTTYVTTDLKSYASGTITSIKVGAALGRLAMATECATASEDFARLFVASDRTTKWSVVGLLFIYNHDGNYDASFDKLLEQVDEKHFALPLGRRMFVLGPKHIEYLYSVAFDIAASRGKAELPAASECSFFYPDLIRTKSRSRHDGAAATLEWLTGPWQILGFDKHVSGGGVQRHSWVYYRGQADNTDEFKYLLDFLFRYQLIEVGHQIRVRVFPSDAKKSQDIAALFAKAKVEYTTAAHPADRMDFEQRLKNVDVSMMSSFSVRFDDTELGMRDA